MNKLRKCKGDCSVYTFEEVCKTCNTPTSPAHPPRFSKEDKYAAYRRKEKYC